MAKLRYVKTLEQVRKAAESNPEFLPSTVRSIRAVYETDPAIAAAVIPPPLELARPEICVTCSHVAMHLSPETTFEIGSMIFGVRAHYQGAEGIYLITMPMTAEAAVVGGRETYGEPKKIAQIDFEWDGDRAAAKVSRMGITYLEMRGTRTQSLGPRELVEHAYCFKAFPSCERGKAFDNDPLLVRLEWRHKHDAVRRMEGEIVLTDSPLDPVADIPVRRLLRMEYEEGGTHSNGKVLRSVPGEWLLPFLHQRYDDTSGEGIEI
jgi:acetoacetate decarboxylase